MRMKVPRKDMFSEKTPFLQYFSVVGKVKIAAKNSKHGGTKGNKNVFGQNA